MKKALLIIVVAIAASSAQRITTIQLDNVQYFVSRMNPYSPELNYFLAYQYCRSLGLQLASFETKEKADTMTQYLKNAGYTKYDFWTSGNKLGTDMFLWMSTGLPFNATFDYMLKRPGNRPIDVPPGTEPQRVARDSGDSGSANGCLAMVAPTLSWEAQDCTLIKDFICEQTRCYYYNYGSIPVSATQGNRRPYITSTVASISDESVDDDDDENDDNQEGQHLGNKIIGTIESSSETAGTPVGDKFPHDPIVGRLITTTVPTFGKDKQSEEETLIKIPATAMVPSITTTNSNDAHREPNDVKFNNNRFDHIPSIASLFSEKRESSGDNIFNALQTHEIQRSSGSSRSTISEMKFEHRQSPEYAQITSTESSLSKNSFEEVHTIGPYDSSQDYTNDQSNFAELLMMKDQEDDSSTILPEAEPAYRYNIKVRSNGKVLDPPSK